MWFVASAKWNVDVRGVLYSQGKVLVPLMRDEVPFSYDHVDKDVVFLWDPATGVALATARDKAKVVSAPVAPGDSAVALYGQPPRDRGYCYRLVTGESLDIGTYPEVAALKAVGVADVPGICYTQEAEGVYHCQRGHDGLRFDQLPVGAVVGGSAVVAGYMLLGVTVAAYVSATGGVRKLLDGVCVSSAVEVDLAVAPDIDRGGGLKRSVRWFGRREIDPGVWLNMGIVQAEGENALPGEVQVDVPKGVGGVLYWNTMQDGMLRTCARRTCGSVVTLDTGGSLAGLYVYAISRFPLPDTVAHKLKYKGYVPGLSGDGSAVSVVVGDGVPGTGIGSRVVAPLVHDGDVLTPVKRG
jgi:hypothetical protein